MSDEAVVDNFAEQVFDTIDTDDTSVDDGPDSFDDLMSGDYDDSNDTESVKDAEDNDSSIPNEESGAADEKIADEDRPAAKQADSTSSEGKEEAGAEGEGKQGELEQEASQSFEVKVDGELTSVSLEDLKSNYSGKVAYDKKFTELDVERKQYEGEVSEVESYINKFGEVAATGDIMGALEYFSSFTSIPAHELRQQLIQQMAPEIDRLRGLSETEIQLEHQKQENDYLQQKYETENQQLQSHQAQREVEKQASGLQQSHNIAPAEWASATEELREHLNEGQELTPELVANYVITDRMFDQAESLLDTVDVNLKEDGSVVQELYNIMNKNPEYTEADLKDIIVSAFGEEQEVEQKQQLTRKVNSNSPKQLKQKISENFEPITIDGEEVDDFDDIL